MSEKNTELSKIVYDFCAKWNIVCDVEQLFAYMHTLALQPKTSQIGLFE
jgi:hypothetical protein